MRRLGFELSFGGKADFFAEFDDGLNALAGVFKNVRIDDGLSGQIKIGLKYTDKKQSVIVGLKRISKPGLRVYAQCEELPKVLGGLGTAIISTSKGVMTDKQARAAKVGGEVLAYIW